MPSTRAERAVTLARANMPPWRKLMPNRTVRRHVQGVDLYLPWSHLLPDYAKSRPSYGQNLVELAAGLCQRLDSNAGRMKVLDVGANIGDSALQIMRRTGADVLCVEGDPYWAEYLRKNLGSKDHAFIAEALLTPAEGEWDSSSPVRVGGTTKFVQAGGGAMPRMSVARLKQLHPEFDELRLVKSDTDGFDAMLVPAVAEVWKSAGPVLFFEFDPILTREADKRDPNALWAQLADLGYTRLVIWDNGGDPLGQLPIDQAAAKAATLEPRPVGLGYYFWDVAACRGDDADALAVFDELVPQAYDVRGTRR
jgi:FkbM family methyltransferase